MLKPAASKGKPADSVCRVLVFTSVEVTICARVCRLFDCSLHAFSLFPLLAKSEFGVKRAQRLGYATANKNTEATSCIHAGRNNKMLLL